MVAAAALSAVVSFVVVGLIRRHAAGFGLLDRPNSRSSHRTPTPRGGGVGIVLGAGAGLLVLFLTGQPFSGKAVVIFLAAGCVAAVGLIDDLRRVGPSVRLLVQIAAALAVVASTGPVPRLPLPEPLAFHIAPVLGWILSCLWIVAVTNFFNFMDGIDGLAGGQAVATCIGIVAAGWGTGPTAVALCAGTACVGFLKHNWWPARVFMGDVGSGFLGFLIAALPFLAANTSRPRALLAVGVGTSLFLLDPIWTLTKRALAGKRLTHAHREHVYQQLAPAGEPVAFGTAAYVAAALALALLGAAGYRHPGLAWLGIVAGVAAFGVTVAAAAGGFNVATQGARFFRAVSRPRVADALLALLIVVGTFCLGLAYLHRSTVAAEYYQYQFGPAVMVATGHGFVNPVAPDASALAQFLAQKRDSLRSESVPAVGATAASNFFQKKAMYLLFATGWVWAVFGISWSSVWILTSALFALTAAVSYGLFRLALTRNYALAGVLLFSFSSVHLNNLPHLRDYSKAPFFLFVILVYGYLIAAPRPARSILGLSVLAGLTIGIGYGFRTDVLALIPLFYVLVWLAPSGTIVRRVGLAALAAVLLTASFLLAALPILRATATDGTNSFHVSVLGFATLFNEKLGVDDPIYEVSHLYEDSYIGVAVNSYARRLHGTTTTVYSRAYDGMCFRYFVEVVRLLPGDMLTRALASSRQISEMALLDFDGPLLIDNGAVARASDAVGAVLRRGEGIGALAIVLCLAGFSFVRFSTGLGTLVLVAFLCSYPMTQFQQRHYFHLGFISVFAVLLAIQYTVRTVRSCRGMSLVSLRLKVLHQTRARKREVRRTLVLAGATVSFLAMALSGARALQAAQLTQLVGSLTGNLQPIAYSVSDLPSGDALITSPEWAVDAPEPGAWSTSYLAIEFGDTRSLPAMSNVTVPVSFVYDSPDPSHRQFTRAAQIPLGGGLRYLFQPVYYGRFGFFDSWDITASFKGVAVPRALLRYIRGVYRVSRLESIPVLLGMSVPLDLRSARLFQVIERSDPARNGPRLGYGFPTALVFENPVAANALAADDLRRWRTDPATVAFAADVVTVTPAGMRIDGVPSGPEPVVLKLADIVIDRRTRYLVIRGTVDTGGFQMGVLMDGKWYSQMVVRNRGKFSAVIETGGSGLYSTLIYSRPDPAGHNRFSIDYVGWSE